MLYQKKPMVCFGLAGLVFLTLSVGSLYLPDPLVVGLRGADYLLAPLTGGFLSMLFAALFACSCMGSVFCALMFFKLRNEKIVQVTGLLIQLRSELTRIATTKNFAGGSWHAVLLEQMRYKLLDRYNAICLTCDKIYDAKLTNLSDKKHAHMYTTIVNQTQNIADQMELMKSELFFANDQAALMECMDTQKRTLINNNYIQNVDNLVMEAMGAHKGRANKKALKAAYRKCVMHDGDIQM